MTLHKNIGKFLTAVFRRGKFHLSSIRPTYVGRLQWDLGIIVSDLICSSLCRQDIPWIVQGSSGWQQQVNVSGCQLILPSQFPPCVHIRGLDLSMSCYPLTLISICRSLCHTCNEWLVQLGSTCPGTFAEKCGNCSRIGCFDYTRSHTSYEVHHSLQFKSKLICPENVKTFCTLWLSEMRRSRLLFRSKELY